MSWAILLAAFSAGFFGSPHCLGMCGGIVTAFGMSMQNISESKKNALILTYHIGRLLSYSLLGLVAGSLGMAVFAPLMSNNIPRMVLGGVLVIIGLSMLGLPFLSQLEKVGMKFWQALTPVRKQVFPIDSFGKALFAGLLWGFLPCGLVYGALALAIAGHDSLTGAVMMFVFGLGTMPMLIATQKMVGVLRQNIQRFKLRQLNGVIMVLSGLAVIVVPMMMHHNHGSHNHNNHQMNHVGMSHDMSMMNHSTSNSASATASNTMPMNHEQMNHDMHNMADMKDMSNDVSMPASASH